MAENWSWREYLCYLVHVHNVCHTQHANKLRDKLLEQGIATLFRKPTDQEYGRLVSWRRRQWHPTPALLPGESSGQKSLVGCSPWGPEESDTTEWLHFTFQFHALEKEMATHSSIFAWRIPGMGDPGGLPSMGSHRVGHDWSDLAAAAAASWRTIWPGFRYWFLSQNKEKGGEEAK